MVVVGRNQLARPREKQYSFRKLTVLPRDSSETLSLPCSLPYLPSTLRTVTTVPMKLGPVESKRRKSMDWNAILGVGDWDSASALGGSLWGWLIGLDLGIRLEGRLVEQNFGSERMVIWLNAIGFFSARVRMERVRKIGH
ncbi:unnamed protein product [Sphenostylis stenocarpa]|uniref:Uncharacterized protein n=1 Tax=Sphenostylis stenocarpa TaxID=92480 RepID=A0AA86SBV7_9FABA|nr:unnamed protein product [Sphenostylis stenocarpa]